MGGGSGRWLSAGFFNILISPLVMCFWLVYISDFLLYAIYSTISLISFSVGFLLFLII